MQIEPQVSVTPILQVTPGSLILFNNNCAFAATTAREPTARVLAVYDIGTCKFIYTPSVIPDQVLIIHGERVVVPDIDSQFEGRPDRTATSELFLDGSRPQVVLHLPAECRLFDLSTGAIEAAPPGTSMLGFRRWSVCVRSSTGELIPIIKLVPHPAAPWVKPEQ